MGNGKQEPDLDRQKPMGPFFCHLQQLCKHKPSIFSPQFSSFPSVPDKTLKNK